LSLHARPVDADIFAETGRTILVVEKESAPDLEGVFADGDGDSAWPDLDDTPRRDRRTLSMAAIGLVVLLFGTALVGLWRWQRIGSQSSSPSGAERLFAESVDTQLEPRHESSRVAPEVVTESEGETGGESGNLAIVWSKRHKDWVTSSPRLAHGHVVYGCRDGRLYAVESNGEVAWEYESGAGIGATPAVDGDRVFCGNYAGRVFAVGAKNGKQAWVAELGARIVASPVVGKKWVFVATQAGELVALQKKNGREAWRHALGGKPRLTPLAVDDHLIIPGAEDEVLCLQQKSGEIEWTYNAGATVTSSPIRVGDRVAFGSKDGGVHMVALRDGGLAWLQRTKGAVQAAPALGKDLLYVASDRRLVALRPQTGEVAWTFPTRAAILAAPSVADGKVYLAAYDRHTYVLDAKSGKERSRLRLKAPIFSSPLVVDGRIYVGSNDGTVYCMTASR
jgi:outer membrane protein assembly factor BamB